MIYLKNRFTKTEWWIDLEKVSAISLNWSPAFAGQPGNWMYTIKGPGFTAEVDSKDLPDQIKLKFGLKS